MSYKSSNPWQPAREPKAALPWRALVGGVFGFLLMILGVLVTLEVIAAANLNLLWMLAPALFPGVLTLSLAYMILRLNR